MMITNMMVRDQPVPTYVEARDSTKPIRNAA